MKTILLIEDDVEIRDLLKSSLLPDNITIFEFIPQNNEQALATEELEMLFKEKTFDLAILDHDLWGGLKGTCFVRVLEKSNTKFIGISSSGKYLQNFTGPQKAGLVLKDYGSKGLKSEEFLKDLETIIKSF
jgi:DNA-binding response OmpR family regulator